MKIKKEELTVTIDMNLEMAKLKKGKYDPLLTSVDISIRGPEGSDDAADYVHERFDYMLPYLIANFFMETITLKHSKLYTKAVKIACQMVLEFIESRSGDDKTAH